MFTKENETHAKIQGVLKTVESKCSLRSCEGTNGLLREMFPDSETVHSFSLSRAKFNYSFV